MAYRIYLTSAALFTLCVLPTAAAAQNVESHSVVAVRKPVAGSGSGGASGPSVIDSLLALRSQSTSSTGRVFAPAPRRATTNHVTVMPLAGRLVPSIDATVDLTETSDDSLAPAPTREVGAQAVSASGFSTYSTQDVAGASDGRFIISNGYDGHSNVQVVYTISGSIVKSTPDPAFWCGGSSPSPGCSLGGFPGDQRYYYDERRGRWITTAMWVFTSSPVPLVLLAVSQGSDPTAGWFVYEFPACGGGFQGGTDQPHTRFNKQWIAVASACDVADKNGLRSTALAVFDKERLYAGDALLLNGNWWEFEDPYSYFNFGRNQPAQTHANTINNREYLTTSDLSSSTAKVIHSYVEGPTTAPVYHPGVETVTTSFQAIGFPFPNLDMPGCMACLSSETLGWVHSSGVYNFRNGVPYIISTLVTGNPARPRSSQVISVATNTSTGLATALRLIDGPNGSGPLASEIAMPLRFPVPGSANEALIVYDYTGPQFYPGIKAVTWNIGTNRTRNKQVVKQGSLTPTSPFLRGRWADFADALIPIPGTSSFVVGAQLATPSASDPERATFWTSINQQVGATTIVLNDQKMWDAGDIPLLSTFNNCGGTLYYYGNIRSQGFLLTNLSRSDFSFTSIDQRFATTCRYTFDGLRTLTIPGGFPASLIRLARESGAVFGASSIDLDTTWVPYSGQWAVSFTGLKSDGSTASSKVQLDQKAGLQTVTLPASFNKITRLDFNTVPSANAYFNNLKITTVP